MKMISKVLAALCLFAFVHAQDGPPQVGFIRLVNAVGPGEGNTHLKVDGEDLYAKGYKLGQRTGGIGLKSGSHKIAVTKDGVETGETSVNVATGETTTLIGFAEKVETEDEEEPFKWQARILKLKQKDAERGYRLTVVSVCASPEVTFRIATEARQSLETKTVKRFNTTTVDLGEARGDVEIRLQGAEEALCGMSFDEPGSYVAVFYDDGEGKIRAMTFYDPKFVIAG